MKNRHVMPHCNILSILAIRVCISFIFIIGELNISTLDVYSSQPRCYQEPYSQHFIFFLTYERAQYACVIYKHSSLVGSFVSYKENEVLRLQYQDILGD